MRNYLIGFGERLAAPVAIRPGGGDKSHPYTFAEAKARLLPRLEETGRIIREIPAQACPGDQAVIGLTLHPAYLAKTYFPEALLRGTGLRAVGSRAVHIVPEKITRQQRSRAAQLPLPAPELFVAGRRDILTALVSYIEMLNPNSPVAQDIRKIETIRALAGERVRSIEGDDALIPLEVVLHATGEEDYILRAFTDWAHSVGASIDAELRLQAGGLCFLPVRAPRMAIDELGKFSFLRVARRMPRLELHDLLSTLDDPEDPIRVDLPPAGPLNSDIRVAIFDGGCPSDFGLTPWVKSLKAPGVGAAIRTAERHGIGVTSALLFGAIRPAEAISAPLAQIDHWQVIDDQTIRDEATEMYSVLSRIGTVLKNHPYDFVCLSIGPALPIEDDEVHAWTAMIDEFLSQGRTVLTTAAGNTGDRDWLAGLARIQPSADAVNGIGVGAADSTREHWRRAFYSSIGPGRSPGFVKPDLLAFGGVPGMERFYVLDLENPGNAAGRFGTSFAAPLALRTGVGIKAHFGDKLSAPAIKALMIHHCDAGGQSRQEVGWGRIPENLDELVVCADGEVHIVYQGKLEPSQWMRFPIPVPTNGFSTRVTIRATLCFFTAVDPEDALNYTRAGLQVVFRPDLTDFAPPRLNPRTKKVTHPAQPQPEAFFQNVRYYSTEAQNRIDAHKWEATLRAERAFEGARLRSPAFDIDYQAREHGHPAARRGDIPYALVVSIIAPSEPDIYNRILTAYRSRLEVLQPIHEVPISIRRR